MAKIIGLDGKPILHDGGELFNMAAGVCIASDIKPLITIGEVKNEPYKRIELKPENFLGQCKKQFSLYAWEPLLVIGQSQNGNMVVISNLTDEAQQAIIKAAKHKFRHVLVLTWLDEAGTDRAVLMTYQLQILKRKG